MDKLFDTALRVAANIRDSTGIGKEIITIGDMAVKIAEESIDDVGSKQILLIGTGETAGMVTKALNKNNYAFNVTSKTIGTSHWFFKNVRWKTNRI